MQALSGKAQKYLQIPLEFPGNLSIRSSRHPYTVPKMPIRGPLGYGPPNLNSMRSSLGSPAPMLETVAVMHLLEKKIRALAVRV